MCGQRSRMVLRFMVLGRKRRRSALYEVQIFIITYICVSRLNATYT